MTLQKAIKIIDWLIQQETTLAQGMKNPEKPWNQDFDCMQKLANSLADNKEHEVQVLKMIRSQILPKCKHPKKMQDRDANGNLYCMDCNWDL